MPSAAARRSATCAGWATLAQLHDATDDDSAAMARVLAAQPEVEYAQPNYIRRLPAWRFDAVRPLATGPVVAGVPNDPDFRALQWNLSLINVPGAWDINPGGAPSVIVAVIDTGVTTAPTTLTRRLWTGQTFDTVSLPFDASPDLVVVHRSCRRSTRWSIPAAAKPMTMSVTARTWRRRLPRKPTMR